MYYVNFSFFAKNTQRKIDEALRQVKSKKCAVFYFIKNQLRNKKINVKFDVNKSPRRLRAQTHPQGFTMRSLRWGYPQTP